MLLRMEYVVVRVVLAVLATAPIELIIVVAKFELLEIAFESSARVSK